MSVRSVVVQLRADVGDFRRQMRTASQDAQDAMDLVGKAVLGVGAAALAGVAVSIKAFADFDQAMSNVEASTHASEGAMKSLRAAALDAGATTVFSATEAAGAIDELSKAGVSTADVLGGGLDGALSLAAAGSLDVGKAAEIAATALTQFKLTGDQIPHVADLLAAGAGKAQGSVEDLGNALKQGGLVASQTGLSIEETTGGLAAFAAAGLTGSDAGTSFKTMLQALTPSSKEAEATMRELGISAYDQQGEFIGLAEFAGNLQTSLAGLSTEQQNAALKTIFGSDAVRAASVLMQNGEQGVRDWTAAVSDQGYAAETAAIKLDNLKGDTEALGGALETAFIGAGSAGDDFARGAVQAVTKVVDLFNGLESSGQGVVLGTVAVVGAIGLVGGAALIAVPKIIAMRAALQTLSTTSPRAAAGLKGLAIAGGIAIGVTALAIAGSALANALNDAGEAPGINSLINSLDALANGGEESVGRLDKAFQNFADTGIGGDSLTEVNDLGSAIDRAFNKTKSQSVEDFVGSIGGLFGATTEMDLLSERFENIDSALSQMVQSGNAAEAADAYAQIVAQFEASGLSAEDAAKAFPGYVDALAGIGPAAEGAAGDLSSVEGAVAAVDGSFAGVSSSAEDAEAALQQFSDTLKAVLDGAFSVEEATDAWASSLNALARAAEENGTALTGNTDEALANREAMRGQVADGVAVIDAMARQGASAEELTAKAAELRQSFIDQAAAAGYNRDEVSAYAAVLDAVPNAVATNLTVTGAEAGQTKVELLRAKLASVNGMQVRATIRVDEVLGTTVQRGAFAGRITERADGGLIPLGLGGPRQDNVPAWLSSGEFVINAAATAKHQPLLEAVNAGKFADGGLVGAGQTVTGGWLNAAQQEAARVTRVNDTRFMAAAAGATAGTTAQAAAESRLLGVRAANVAALKALKDASEAEEKAAKERADAEEEAAKRELDRIKDLVAAEKQAFEDRQDAEEFAFNQRAERDAEGAKRAASDALDALKARNKDGKLDAQVDALERAQKDRSQSAEETAENAKRAFKLAQEKDARDLEARQKAFLTSIEDENTAAKKRNEAATDALKDANEQRIDTEEALADGRATAAEDELTAAKDAAAAATQELKDAEDELNATREKALALATQIATTITGAFNLDKLVGTGGSFEQVIARAQKEVARAKELSDSIVALTEQGLDAALVDQLTAAGTGGLDVVRKLLTGGAEGVGQLNAALGEIRTVGSDLGSYVSATRYSPTVTAVAPAYQSLTLDAASVKAIAQAVSDRPVNLLANGNQIATVVTAAQNRVSYLNQGAPR